MNDPKCQMIEQLGVIHLQCLVENYGVGWLIELQSIVHGGLGGEVAWLLTSTELLSRD